MRPLHIPRGQAQSRRAAWPAAACLAAVLLAGAIGPAQGGAAGMDLAAGLGVAGAAPLLRLPAGPGEGPADLAGPGTGIGVASPSSQARADRAVLEQNVGQWAGPALFRARAPGYDAFVTPTGLVLVQTRAGEASPPRGDPLMLEPPTTGETDSWATHVSWVGANPAPLVATGPLAASSTNYLRGNDPAHWHVGVPSFAAVTLRGVYPGIDLAYHAGPEGGLKYDFIVHPGADPSVIRQRIEGATVAVEADGTLVLATGLGDLRHGAPATMQADGRSVANRYEVAGDTVSFRLGPYDAAQDLVIDPLVSSTFLGGGGRDAALALALDASGNAYVAGVTGSTDFPATAGAYRTVRAGREDAFVTKMSAGGGNLYTTYLGGAGDDAARGIAIDAWGDVYVTGETSSVDFPATAGAYKLARTASREAFVTKLAASGASLAYSTYLGSGDGRAIAVDAAGQAYVAGRGFSGFPTTAGAYQAANAGSSDAFVTKLNAAGSALVYSTFVGGPQNLSPYGVYFAGFDFANAIALGPSGTVFITGLTSSHTFPTTPGAYQTTPAYLDTTGGLYCWCDAFVTKLNAAGSALAYSTYLGGDDSPGVYDEGHAIVHDGTGAVVVAGGGGVHFPTTPGAYQANGAGSADAFVAKLNAAGSALAYGTRLGGSGDDVARALLRDGSGNVAVAGWTGSADFPVAGAFQATFGGGASDAFLAKLNPTATTLLWSTYLGGTGSDDAHGVGLDAGAHVVAGSTESAGFPTTLGVSQPTKGGGFDAYVARLAPGGPTAPQSLSAAQGAGTGEIALAWQAPASDGGSPVTGYRVVRGTASGDEAAIASGPCASVVTALSCMDTGLDDAVTYHYKVNALTASGEGPRSAGASATTPFDVPTAPQALAATPGPGAGQIRLTWQAPADDGGGVSSYKVYRGTSPGGETLVASGGCAALGNVLTCTDTGLGDGVTRHYKVSASNVAGEGPRSGGASATTFVLPEAPTGLSATAGPGAGEVTLTWTAPSAPGGPITAYHVYGGASAGGETLVASGGCAGLGNVLTCTDTGTGDGVTRHYKVRAVNPVGAGPPSAGASATTFTLPSEPQDFQVSTTGSALSWTPPATPGGTWVRYNVYRNGQHADSTSELSYVDPWCPLGTVCHYKVAAYNPVGVGPATPSHPSVGLGSSPPPDDPPPGGSPRPCPIAVDGLPVPAPVGPAWPVVEVLLVAVAALVDC